MVLVSGFPAGSQGGGDQDGGGTGQRLGVVGGWSRLWWSFAPVRCGVTRRWSNDQRRRWWRCADGLADDEARFWVVNEGALCFGLYSIILSLCADLLTFYFCCYGVLLECVMDKDDKRKKKEGSSIFLLCRSSYECLFWDGEDDKEWEWEWEWEKAIRSGILE